ncbi:hypothetical protein Tco_1053478 [Tanacetum coccineum]
MFDETLAIPLNEIQIDDKLHFIKKPVEIIDHEVKYLKQSRIPIVNVRWNSRRGPEFTWEREDQMQKKYLHLFANHESSSNATYVVSTGKVIATVSIKVPTGRKADKKTKEEQKHSKIRQRNRKDRQGETLAPPTCSQATNHSIKRPDQPDTEKESSLKSPIHPCSTRPLRTNVDKFSKFKGSFGSF